MPNKLSFVVVEKSGTIKAVSVKEINFEEIYKKCGFRKGDDFECRTTWEDIEVGKTKHTIQLWARSEGKANTENKYDFPPPIDTKLFFGSCALVGFTKNETIKGEKTLCNLSLGLWNKIYEKLFGGFENLALSIIEDEEEEDELAAIPASKKTKKGGYLKDGFVVDTDEDNNSENESEDESEDMDDSEETTDKDEGLILEDIGSELSEETYDYSTESSSDSDPK